MIARFVRAGTIVGCTVGALLLAGCQEMSDLSIGNYRIFGPPATGAPQTVTRPTPEQTAEPAPPATTETVPEPLPLPLVQPTIEDRPVVALLLPLSGPNGAVGRALFDAATLALFDIGDEYFILLPRDTAGTPDGATAAAQDAINAGARLIIGPLFSTEVAGVASVARPAGVNVVSLSNDRSVAGPGVYVFGLSPQDQVDRIVGYARSRGLQRYAALLPANTFGAAVEERARRVTVSGGGQMAVIERYDPAAGDTTPVVRRLASYEQRRAAALAQRKELEGRDDEVSKLALRRLEGQETIGEVSFDSVLLPDFGDRLLSIAPLLPYYDIDPARIRFLGSALWDDPRLTREPALIGGWFPAPPPEARAEFQRRYREVFGGDAPRIATLGYDAAALAAVLARGSDFSASALGNPNGFAGADGIFRFLPDGTAERGLAVLEVRRDGFRTISPAPNDFRDVTR